MTVTDLVVGLIIAVGIVGVIVPVLPGLVLVVGAVLVWSVERQDVVGWVVLAVAALIFLTGQLAKYLVPGRQLRQAGIPWASTGFGALLGIVGFFVVPVIGLVLGFVLGVYLAERLRLGTDRAAWLSTKHALRAAGWSVLIELTAGLLIAAVWLTGVFV